MSMVVTFFIGNGFDLGLGFKTSYKQFIAKYADLSKGYNPHTAEGVLKEAIYNAPTSDTWADAEMAFARLPFSKLLKDFKDFDRTMLMMLEGFQHSLVDYLKKEVELNPLKISSLQSVLRDRMVHSIFEGMHPDVRAQEVAIWRKADCCLVNCVNFNYTEVFDALVVDGWLPPHAATTFFSIEGNQIPCSINPVVHVHGKLDYRSSIFGVSELGQISDEKARNLAFYSGALIKSRIDRERNAEAYQQTSQMLAQSHRVVIFGSSMGRSDIYWWKELAQKLIADKDFKVIIFPWSLHPCELKTDIDWLLLRKQWRMNLLESTVGTDTLLSEEKLSECMDRVVVLNYGPYARHESGCALGDPWCLEYLGEKLRQGLGRAG